MSSILDDIRSIDRSELFKKLPDIPKIMVGKVVKVHYLFDTKKYVVVNTSRAPLARKIRSLGLTIKEYINEYNKLTNLSITSLKSLPLNEIVLDDEYHEFILDGTLIKVNNNLRSTIEDKLVEYNLSLKEYLLLFIYDIDYSHEVPCLLCDNEPRVLGNYYKGCKNHSRLSLNHPIYLLPYCSSCSGRWKRISSRITSEELYGKEIFTRSNPPHVNVYEVDGVKCQGSYEKKFVEAYDKKVVRGPSIEYEFKNKSKTYHVDFIDESGLLIEVKSTFTLIRSYHQNLEKFKMLLSSYGKFLLVLDHKSYLIKSMDTLLKLTADKYFEYLSSRGFNLGIIGSRDYNKGVDRLDGILRDFSLHPDKIVSGHGGKADISGEKLSELLGIDSIIFPANWKKYGKRAGFMRNSDIETNSHVILSLWDRKSRGTLDTMKKAKLNGKIIIIYDFIRDEFDLF